MAKTKWEKIAEILEILQDDFWMHEVCVLLHIDEEMD